MRHAEARRGSTLASSASSSVSASASAASSAASSSAAADAVAGFLEWEYCVALAAAQLRLLLRRGVLQDEALRAVSAAAHDLRRSFRRQARQLRRGGGGGRPSGRAEAFFRYVERMLPPPIEEREATLVQGGPTPQGEPAAGLGPCSPQAQAGRKRAAPSGPGAASPSSGRAEGKRPRAGPTAGDEVIDCTQSD